METPNCGGQKQRQRIRRWYELRSEHNAEIDRVLGEYSSVSCSGKENVTDTFGQALWLADSSVKENFTAE